MTGTTVTIDGQSFTLRCLTSDEWDAYVSTHETNGSPFYWEYCFTWTQTANGSSRVIRGANSASCSADFDPARRERLNEAPRFRPVLELVP